jgi:hypothetical protein
LPVLLDGARRISRALGAMAPSTPAAMRTNRGRRPAYRPLTGRTHS